MDSSYSDANGMGSSEGATYTIDLENPIIALGMKFKNDSELRFCLR